MEKLISILGLATFLFLAYLLSENKRAISWRLTAWGVSLQIVFALLILKTKPGELFFSSANAFMTGILSSTQAGAQFLFGRLAADPSFGAHMAFSVLPVIVFTSSLMALLYFFKVIQFIVNILARIMHRTMKVSGAEALSAALLVFMGIESITAVKTYIRKMTRSEIFTVMCAYAATIAGSVMAIYVSFGAEAGHLLAASVMSAPAAIVISKILIPETEHPLTEKDADITLDVPYGNPLEAASDGASDGARLALNIGAMLLAFYSLIAMLNSLLEKIHLSFEKVLGIFFMPFAWLMGVPWKEAPLVGELLGLRVVTTEFLSYLRMKDMVAGHLLTERSVIISTYALCGFTSVASIAILIGGIAGLAPEKKKIVVSLGFRAIAAALLANFMTATIAGVLI